MSTAAQLQEERPQRAKEALSMSKQPRYEKLIFCCMPVLFFIFIPCLVSGSFYWVGAARNDKLLSGKKDEAISQELNEIAMPVIDMIYLYKSEHGEYPGTVDQLIPDYLEQKPSEYLEGRLVYNASPYYGVPFYCFRQTMERAPQGTIQSLQTS